MRLKDGRTGGWFARTHARYVRFTRRFSSGITVGSGVLYGLSLLASLVTLVTLVVVAGYEHSAADMALLTGILRVTQWTFITAVVYNLVLRFRHTVATTGTVKWIVDIAVLLTLPALIYPCPRHPWIPVLETIFYSRWLFYGAIAAYSVVEICYGLLLATRRRTNPSILLSGSFLFFIIIGSFVLMLPRFTTVPVSYIDSLFVATSAVCITGLTPVDIASTFTPEGYIVLCVLFQVGALGVLTFTCFFAMFFSGATSVYNQLLVRDIIYSKTMNALGPTLLYIMMFTMCVEAAGAVAVYFTIPDGLLAAESDKVMFAVFHSISSFCNVGYSCLPGGMSNPALMTATQSAYTVTSLLVIAGGIGFPILVNFKDAVVTWVRRMWYRLRGGFYNAPVHQFDLNTKLVLSTYFIILGVASVAFFILEYDNTLAGMSLWQKIVQSVFNSLTPRSAGFASVSVADYLPATLLLFMVQMWIGGGSQSLAGGIKVNTAATVWLTVRAQLHGASRPRAFGRAVSVATTRRANVVIALSIAAYVVLAFILLLADSHLGVKELLFEAVSALFTVGSSFGITPQLSITSKLAVCVAMFVGRVGIISILTGIVGQRPDISRHLPEDSLIIS